MLRQLCVCAAIIVLVTATQASAQVLFSDGMSSSANWTFSKTADTSSQFNFDYSIKGIPVAPRGKDSIGLKLEANNAAPGAVESIVARHADAAFTGQYTLRVDIWSNYAWAAGGAGTTEHAGVGVGHNGVATGVNGASFLFAGDGGVGPTSTPNGDFAFYKDAAIQQPPTGQYAAGSAGAGNKDNTDPLYTDAFPVINVLTTVPSQNQLPETVQAAGSGGFQWMTLNVEVDTTHVGPSGLFPANLGFARFSMRSATSGNSIAIGTIDNSQASTPVNLSGAVDLIANDQFSSVTTNAALDFTVFDNVIVYAGLVPLPDSNGPGDFDHDLDVDGEDFLSWQRGDTITPVSSLDLDDWKMNFGSSFASVATGLAVPEPASFLIVLCLTAALGRRRI